MSELRCLIPVCHGCGELKKITNQGIKTFISSAKARGNEEFVPNYRALLMMVVMLPALSVTMDATAVTHL